MEACNPPVIHFETLSRLSRDELESLANRFWARNPRRFEEQLLEMYARRPGSEVTCLLCGQMVLGYGTAMSGTTTAPLCHSAERDCYHRWTVWGERPGTKRIDGKVGAER